MTCRVVQWNTRNLTSNKSHIQSMCSSLNPSILCIQETWGRADANLKLPGFNLISFKNRLGSVGGGVAIYAKPTISITPIDLDNPLEVCAARVFYKNLKYTLISLYCPPNHNNASLIENLKKALEVLPAPFLICCDSNGHHPQWGSEVGNARGTHFYDFVQENELSICNNGTPTYECSNGTFTHIDLSIVSVSMYLSVIWNVWYDNLHSDHFPIYLDFYDIPYETLNPEPRFNLGRADWQKYQSSIDLPLPPFDDPSNVCALLENTIKNAATASIPLKKPCNKPQFCKNWWNEDCRGALKNKRRAFNLYKRDLGNMTKWIEYKRCKAIMKVTYQRAKNESFKKFVSSINCHTSSKTIWEKVQSLRSRSFKQSIVLKNNDLFISNPKETADLLAQNFANRGSNIEIEPENLHHVSSQSAFLPYSNSPKYNSPFSLTELRRVLGKKNSNTPGPDDIHPALIKNLNNKQLEQLLNIFNYFWCAGLPSQWKSSIIIPLLKFGKIALDPNSYRPISLTNFLCKTLERMVVNRLKSYLENENIFDEHQYGFRPALSTTDAICSLENSIRQEALRGKATLAVFLDITQAFDSVWHAGLLSKVRSLGVSGNMYNFIRCFISDRNIQVKCQGVLSDPQRVDRGVPQGSVISPILFTLMINDLFNSLPSSISHSLYADDVALWFSGEDLGLCLAEVQLALDGLNVWSGR